MVKVLIYIAVLSVLPPLNFVGSSDLCGYSVFQAEIEIWLDLILIFKK